MIKRMLLLVAWVLVVLGIVFGNAGQGWFVWGSLLVLTILGVISVFGLVSCCD